MHWQEIIKKLKSKVPFWKEWQLKQLDKIADTTPGVSLLPESVASSENIEEPTEKRLILKFDYFQERECRFAEIDETKIRAIFRKLTRITQLKVRELSSSGIIRRKLDRHNRRHKDYQSLFMCIPEDEEDVYEIAIPNNGRIYFFQVENEIQIVSIETKHRDTHTC